MRVVCEACGAAYNLSEEKLTRDVSRARCKKCGEQMVIRRTSSPVVAPIEEPRQLYGWEDDEEGGPEHTIIAQVPELRDFDNMQVWTRPTSSGSGPRTTSLPEKQASSVRLDSPVAAPTPTPMAGATQSRAAVAVATSRGKAGERMAPPLATGALFPDLEHAGTGGPRIPSGIPVGYLDPARAALLEDSEDAPTRVDTLPLEAIEALERGMPEAAPPPPIPRTSSPSGRMGAPLPFVTTGIHPSIPAAPDRPLVQPTSFAQPGRRPDLIQVFAERPSTAGAAAQARYHAPYSSLPALLMLGALGGMMLFVPDANWGVSGQSIAGFLLALFGVLGAWFAHQQAQGSGVRFPQVVIGPAVVCFGLALVLARLQAGQIVFVEQMRDELSPAMVALLPPGESAGSEGPSADAQDLALMPSGQLTAVAGVKASATLNAEVRMAAVDPCLANASVERASGGDVILNVRMSNVGRATEVALVQPQRYRTGPVESCLKHRLLAPTFQASVLEAGDYTVHVSLK